MPVFTRQKSALILVHISNPPLSTCPHVHIRHQRGREGQERHEDTREGQEEKRQGQEEKRQGQEKKTSRGTRMV